MKKEDLLFFYEYEQFYAIANSSNAFKSFCKEAFGKDFSQDGFSDIRQVNRILKYIPTGYQAHILDIGCGNGKMLGYLQEKTGATIYGFDYSDHAIHAALDRFGDKGFFIQGCIGEVEYPAEKYDVIISMDTMYFAPDMSLFIDQIISWLKKDGVFFVCYQEGDVMPKTKDAHSTVFAQTLLSKNIPFTVENITGESYEVLLQKRKVALAHEQEFADEGNDQLFKMLVAQTEYANDAYHDYENKLARYIYVVRK